MGKEILCPSRDTDGNLSLHCKLKYFRNGIMNFDKNDEIEVASIILWTSAVQEATRPYHQGKHKKWFASKLSFSLIDVLLS